MAEKALNIQAGFAQARKEFLALILDETVL
jgi:hypothetical protein